MAPFSWSRWLRSLFRRPPSRPFRRRRPHGLGLEQLETRLAPATAIWTGMAGSNWNNMGDWLRNGVPGIPQPGDDLVFPGNVAQLTIVNDLPSGESFNSLSFSDLNDLNGYVISGNAITLGDPSTPGSGNINVAALVPNVDVKLPIQFAGPGGSRQFITVGGGATLTLAGALSGTTGAELTKESQGTLVLTADNSAFTGPITVDTNGGILRISNPFALGDSTSVTTVQTNGQLQVADLEGLVVPEQLILNGAGPDNRGALLGLAGHSVWGGNITLDSDTTIGSLAGDLTIDGVIGDLGAGHGITKEGPGQVDFTQADTYRGPTVVNDGVLDIQNGLALGPGDDLPADGVTVNQSTSEFGALWVDDPTGVGFTVPDKLITINGLGASSVQDVLVHGTAGTFTLTFTFEAPPLAPPNFTTISLPVGASAAQVQTAIDALSNVSGIGGFVNVTETTSPAGNLYEILFGGTLATVDVPELIPGSKGGDTATVSIVRQGDHGSLRNAEGFNTWTGDVILGSPLPNSVAPAIGVAEATTLTIMGVVKDPVAPPPVDTPPTMVKVDTGTLIFTSANTYKPDPTTGIGTDVQGGVLEIEDSKGLGTGGVVVEDGASLGLGVDDIPDSVTGTINTLLVSNPLTITGQGASVLGALVNFSGINVYSGSIDVESNPSDHSASIGVQPDPNPSSNTSYFPTYDPASGAALTGDYSLTITGPISGAWSEYQDILLSKLGPNGTPIPPTSGTWTITFTYLAPPPSPPNYTTTDLPPLPFDATAGQVEADLEALPNIGLGNVVVTEFLTPEGNLYDIQFVGALAGLRLPQLIPNLSVGLIDTVTTSYSLLDKYGGGQLILPKANNGLNWNIDIVQGWVTIENNNSLGQTVPDADQNLQPTTTVEEGAALHLMGSATNPVDMTQNLVLDGTGFDHTFGEINQQGALENIDGINTINSNITLEGPDGIGVEQIFGHSQLYLTGNIYDQQIVHTIAAHSPGGSQETDDFFDTGGTSGTITLTYNMYGLPDSMDVYYGIKGQGGTLIYTTNGLVSGTNTVNLTYGPGTSTIIEVVMDAGGVKQFNTEWYFTAAITPNIPVAGGIIKLGSQLLVIQANGTYLGPVDIRQGVLLDQSNTGLGAGALLGAPVSADPTVTVETGAALALTSFVVPTSSAAGAISSGIDVWNEHLIVNGPGNDTLGVPLGAINVLATDDLTAPNDTTIVPADMMWRGPVTLESSSTFNLDAGTRLFLLGDMDDASNPTGGSDLIKVGDGELVLEGTNSYRGNTYIGSPISPPSFPVVPNDAPLPDLQTFEMSGSTGTFNLSLTFGGNSATTASALSFGASAAQMQTAIGGLLTALGISGGTVTVTQTGSYYAVLLGGTLAGNTPALLDVTPLSGDIVDPVPIVTTTQGGDPSLYFQNSLAPVDGGILTVANSLGLGTATGNVVVQSGSSLQLEANVIVAGKTLIVSGSGAPTVGNPLGVSWFSEGPGSIVDAGTLGTQKATISGYVTDVAIDPTDTSTMYITTAGGGVWRTQDGGKTWFALWNDALSFYDGVIAMDPTDPLHLYVGTGLQDNSINSFAGTGLYQSYDGGETWSLMTGAGGANPFLGRAITAIAFDPFDPDNNPASPPTVARPDGAGPVLYIADSDQTVDGTSGAAPRPSAFTAWTRRPGRRSASSPARAASNMCPPRTCCST